MRPFDCDTAGLFEGYGGLTMATRQVFGGNLGWYSEIEPAACRLLEHHHPDVPNLGDITQVDWSEAPRPRRLAGGFPCQDVSAAGLLLGLRPGTRSGLWTHFAYAIDQLRPELVVIENVRGLLSAEAACDLEPCPWCVGDAPGKPLRALGAVLGDLAELGYDAQWVGLRAADVGAPHGRFRVFIAAWPNAGHADSGDRHRRATAGLEGEAGPTARPAADAGDYRRELNSPVRPGPEESGIAGDRGAAADADGLGPVRGGSARRRGSGPAHHHLTAANAVRGGREGHSERDCGAQDLAGSSHGEDAARRVLDWGAYEPAVRRWEHILGRVAPTPTMVGKRGGQQLSPAFVEWMMGLPEGWVTAVPGVSRNEQLKMLGNGVVPAQCEAALRWLLALGTAEAAA